MSETPWRPLHLHGHREPLSACVGRDRPRAGRDVTGDVTRAPHPLARESGTTPDREARGRDMRPAERHVHHVVLAGLRLCHLQPGSAELVPTEQHGVATSRWSRDGAADLRPSADRRRCLSRPGVVRRDVDDGATGREAAGTRRRRRLRRRGRRRRRRSRRRRGAAAAGAAPAGEAAASGGDTPTAAPLGEILHPVDPCRRRRRPRRRRSSGTRDSRCSGDGRTS